METISILVILTIIILGFSSSIYLFFLNLTAPIFIIPILLILSLFLFGPSSFVYFVYLTPIISITLLVIGIIFFCLYLFSSLFQSNNLFNKYIRFK